MILQDRKQRFYIVSALANTKVDIKGMNSFALLKGTCWLAWMDDHDGYLFHQSGAVLSQRLGLGKGGLRMAPAEALGEILQVCLSLCCYYICWDIDIIIIILRSVSIN